MKKVFWISSILFVLGTLFLLYKWSIGVGLVWFTNNLDGSIASNFGEFYGGVFGTLVAGIACIAAYSAFSQSKKDSISTKFYEMLDMHQKDIDELKENNPNIFEKYLELVRAIHNVINSASTQGAYSPIQRLHLAYLLFFYGTSSDIQTRFINNQTDIENIDETVIEEDLNVFKTILNNHLAEFNGYYHEFGIYFRQLYQTVKYIDEQKLLSYSEKYGYIKTLRARLNIHEQYLLFINSLIESGKDWEELSKEDIGLFLRNRGKQYHDSKTPTKEQIEKCWITKYNLIKNIPNEMPIIGDIKFKEIFSFVEYEGDGINEDRASLCKIMNWVVK